MPKPVSGTIAPCLTAIVCFLGLTPPVQAAPACPTPITLTQPDGTVLRARRVGNGWCHGLAALDGTPLVRGEDGWWRPRADGDDSDGRSASWNRAAVSAATCASSPWRLERTPAAAPPQRVQPYAVLMILVSFRDQPPTYPASTFAELLGTDLDAYYGAVSWGAAHIEPARESYGTPDDGVVGWLSLPIPHPDTGPMLRLANQRLARTAIEAADPFVDYSSYDVDGDGYVDSDELAVVVVAAGYDYAYANLRPSVWAHSWWLNTVPPAVVDGVTVGAYHANQGGYTEIGEIHASTDADAHSARVGLVAHELGHLIFRLPDLYDIDNSSEGVGAYCLMGAGSWGFVPDGEYPADTPTIPSAYVRWRLGWSDAPVQVGEVALRAAGSPLAGPDNTVVRVETPDMAQCFLVENREPMGYDLGLTGLLGSSFGGMAIWHINLDARLNAVDFRRLADLEEADGSDNPWTPQVLWYAGNPASDGVFGPFSTPSSDLIYGRPSGVVIRDFSEAGETMRATVETSVE